MNQSFALCDNVSNGLLTVPVSGLAGLGWQSIASSGATPFWETLAKGGAWDDPVMAFQLTRYVNNTRADALEAGGSFTMGGSYRCGDRCEEEFEFSFLKRIPQQLFVHGQY